MPLSKLPRQIAYIETTPGGKWQECVLFKEQLRLEFNQHGEAKRGGTMSSEVWVKYYEEEYEPRIDWVSDEIFRLEQAIINGG